MLLFLFLFSVKSAQQQQNVDPLQLIQQYRAFQQWPQCKSILDQIIDKQGKQADVMIYRLRAEALLNMDMPEEALEDIEIAFRKNPSQEENKNLNLLAATAHIQLGDSDQAEIEAETAEDPQMIANTREFTKLVSQAEELYDDEKYAEAAKVYDKLLVTCTHAYELTQRRLELAWILGQTIVYEERAKKLVTIFEDDSELNFRYGVSLMCNGKFGDGKKYFQKVKEMDYPPDNLSTYIDAATKGAKLIADVHKSMNKRDFKAANTHLDTLNQDLDGICFSSSGISALSNYLRAKILAKDKKYEEAIALLDKSIENDQDNVDYLLYRSELALETKDYDAAIFDLTRLQRMKPNDNSILRKLQRAQELKNKATRVDYYKVLGVPHGCTLNQIKDAYRKLAREWHPDRYQDKAEKKHAEEMMKSINTAYDILTDPGKRQWYDAGRDMEQYQQGAENMQQGDLFELLKRQQQQQGNGQQYVFFQQ